MAGTDLLPASGRRQHERARLLEGSQALEEERIATWTRDGLRMRGKECPSDVIEQDALSGTRVQGRHLEGDEQLRLGGLHPLSRPLTGYPPQLIWDVIRNSNAVVALTAQLQSILTGLPENMGPVRRMHQEFTDVLPIIAGR